MARLRKYRDAPMDGDAAIADDPVLAPAAPAAEVATARPTEDSALMRAVEATRRADDLQRQRAQQQQPMTVAEYIDSLDVSGHKKTFLKEHPQMLEPALVPVMAKVYHAGLRSGLEDDSAALDQFILDGVARELEQHGYQTDASEPAGALPGGRGC
jgi:hypothetical protein